MQLYMIVEIYVLSIHNAYELCCQIISIIHQHDQIQQIMQATKNGTNPAVMYNTLWAHGTGHFLYVCKMHNVYNYVCMYVCTL